MMKYPEVEKNLEVIQKKLNVALAYWYPHGRNPVPGKDPNDYCERVEMRLSVPGISDQVSQRIAQLMADKYKVNLGHHSYTPEDMSEPLEKYDYFEVTVREINELENGVKTLANARQEFKEKMTKLQDHLVDLVMKES